MMLVFAACGRSGMAGDAGADANAGPGTSAGTGTTGTESEGASVDPGRARPRRDAGKAMEARRSSVARVEAEPALAANVELLKKQFGGVMPASIGMQATELTAVKRRAVLVGAERRDGTLESPLVLIVDERGTLVWSKERPAAGIKPPVSAIAIAAGPEGRFALAVCDPPTASVALRLWDGDGSPFADFAALESKGCDALSLLYWPGRGWIIVAAGPSETRAQLVTEGGAMAWGAGKVLGARWRTTAPLALAADTPSSFVSVQYSQSPGVDREADHAVAYRYDETGQPLWPAPVDLGSVRRIAPGQERIALLRTSDGVLRAALAGATVELRSNGEIRRIP